VAYLGGMKGGSDPALSHAVPCPALPDLAEPSRGEPSRDLTSPDRLSSNHGSASMDTEEYALLQQIIRHYAVALNAERAKTADLTRQLDCLRERLQLLEAAGYGLI
jgi:hypothetical protein